MTLEAVKEAITQFSTEELTRFRHWFAEFDGKKSETQSETDTAADRLDALAEEALAAYRAGKIPEI